MVAWVGKGEVSRGMNSKKASTLFTRKGRSTEPTYSSKSAQKANLDRRMDCEDRKSVS